MSDGSSVIRRLLEADALRRPVLRAAINAAGLPRGSAGIDVGCGIGLQARLLAEAVGADGRVTGLDIDPELVAHAAGLAADAGLAERVTFRAGDMHAIPLDDRSVDWAWSADCAGYPAGPLAPILAELTRVVRPGGSVVVVGWSSQQVLPGHPGLEARLNARCSAYEPFLAGMSPETHFLRAARAFVEAGLVEVITRTFIGDVRAPLDPPQRIALAGLLEMLWRVPSGGVSDDDVRSYQRLCSARSEDFILDVPGYYAFFTYTMFRGRVPAP